MKQVNTHVSFLMSGFTAGVLAGSRYTATPLRDAVATAYSTQLGDILLDFKGVQITQSFMDEVIGKLILEKGPDVLNRLIFKNCSKDTQAIIKFIASDRSDQYIKRNIH